MCSLMPAGEPVAPVLSDSDAPVLFGCSAFMVFSPGLGVSSLLGQFLNFTQSPCLAANGFEGGVPYSSKCAKRLFRPSARVGWANMSSLSR